MISDKVELVIDLPSPLSSTSLKSTAPFVRLFHLLTFSIEVGQRREIVRVVEANRYLILSLLLLFVATIHGLSLVLGARLLALGAIHETTERVLFEFNASSHKTLTLSHLDILQERVHDCSEGLRFHILLWLLWIYTPFEQRVGRVFVVHDHEDLICQLFLWRRLGHFWLNGRTIAISGSITSHVSVF